MPLAETSRLDTSVVIRTSRLQHAFSVMLFLPNRQRRETAFVQM
jgi:hypothetical protein